MATNSTGDSTTTTISLKPSVAKEGKIRASNLDLSFSAYVQKLIERDLVYRPDMVLSEKRSVAG